MAICDDHFACAVREVTRRGGCTIWADPGRLRSRLQYEMGAVSSGQSALLDALVIAAMQGIPRALLDHDDLQPRLIVLADSVGPLLAADAVGAWMRALAEPELACVELESTPFDIDIEPDIEPEPEPETFVVALVSDEFEFAVEADTEFDLEDEFDLDIDLDIEPEPEFAEVEPEMTVAAEDCDEDEAAVEHRVLTLIEKLRPPPPVSINA